MLVSFLDHFKQTLIIVHPTCSQRYYAYLFPFDSNVKNPLVIVIILPGFFGQAVFLLTVFHCIILYRLWPVYENLFCANIVTLVILFSVFFFLIEFQKTW